MKPNKLRRQGSDSYPDTDCPYNKLQFSWKHSLWWEGWEREKQEQNNNLRYSAPFNEKEIRKDQEFKNKTNH